MTIETRLGIDQPRPEPEAQAQARPRPESRRLTRLQQEWLARIGDAGPEGLPVDRKEARRTIDSLLARELIRHAAVEDDDETGRRTCGLTRNGKLWIWFKVAEPRIRAEAEASRGLASRSMPAGIGNIVMSTAPALPGGVARGVGLGGAPVRRTARTRDPVAGDAVSIIYGDLLGQTGRVKYVNNRLRKVCVCVPVDATATACDSYSLGFDDLLVLPDLIVDYACRGCRDLASG